MEGISDTSPVVADIMEVNEVPTAVTDSFPDELRNNPNFPGWENGPWYRILEGAHRQDHTVLCFIILVNIVSHRITALTELALEGKLPLEAVYLMRLIVHRSEKESLAYSFRANQTNQAVVRYNQIFLTSK